MYTGSYGGYSGGTIPGPPPMTSASGYGGYGGGSTPGSFVRPPATMSVSSGQRLPSTPALGSQSYGMYQGAAPMASQPFRTQASMPPPAPPSASSGPAMVPRASGAWMSRVSYREIVGSEKEEMEDPIPRGKEELIRYCQQQDEKIQELKVKAGQLRAKQHGDHDKWVRRVEDLEAHVLSAKLKPVAAGKDAARKPPEIPQDLTPNGLLQEFADRTTAAEINEDMTPDEEDEYNDQLALVAKSEQLGLPSIEQLGLPEGSKIIDIRMVDGGFVRHQMRQERQRMMQQPPPVQPPSLRGRIYDSNMALTPSPLHPVGPVSQMGLLQNLYPIDRCPIDTENVFQASWPGAEEQWYTAYGDYFQSRQFPTALYPEANWERDVDRGRNVRNVQWRSEPSGDHMASIGVDLNNDGFADVVVVGKDKNFDGVPDILQVNPGLRMAQNVCSKIFPT